MLGDKILVGYPKKKYFELYVEREYSKKIYSVQTRDFPNDLPAVIYIPEENQGYSRENGKAHQKHVFVVPTQELESFLASRGVECYTQLKMEIKNDPLKQAGQTTVITRTTGNTAWVNRYAFDWVEPEEEITVEIKTEDKKPNYKNKSLLALAVAVISLLN